MQTTAVSFSASTLQIFPEKLPVAELFGKKSQMSEVDGGYGYRLIFQTMHTFEQRTVASAAEHQSILIVALHLALVYRLGGYGAGCQRLHHSGELAVYGVAETVILNE